jgi:predicted dehydrogenase
LHIGALNAGDLRIMTAAGERIETHPPAANLHAPLVEDFVNAVSNGRQPAVSGGIGRTVAELEDAIYASLR